MVAMLNDPPPARFWHTLTRIDDEGSKFFLYGGMQPDNTVLSDGLLLQKGWLLPPESCLPQLDNNSWIPLLFKGSSPSRRYMHATICLANQVYVVGGFDNNTVFDDVFVANVSHLGWDRCLISILRRA